MISRHLWWREHLKSWDPSSYLVDLWIDSRREELHTVSCPCQTLGPISNAVLITQRWRIETSVINIAAATYISVPNKLKYHYLDSGETRDSAQDEAGRMPIPSVMISVLSFTRNVDMSNRAATPTVPSRIRNVVRSRTILHHFCGAEEWLIDG